MTQEQRVFITADDVLELELCCTNDRCNARISYPVSKGFSPPIVCPSCNQSWFMPGRDDERKTLLYSFVDSIKKMRELKSLPFTLRMRVSSGHEEDGRA